MSHRASGAPRGLAARGALVLLALFVEATLLTQRFDVGALREVEAGWARVLVASQVLLPCAIAVAAAIALFGRELFAGALRQHDAGVARPGFAIALHVLAFGAFWTVTNALFVDPPTSPVLGWTLLVGWLGATAVSLSSAALIVLPAPVWRHLRENGAGTFLFGASVGLLAFAVGQGVESSVWPSLAEPTLRAVQAVLRSIGTEIVPGEGLVTGTATFRVQVGVGCSGFEGIGLTWIFLSFYLWVARERLRFPRALWLLPIGTLAAWTANVARISTLILLGDGGWPELAVGGFHTRMGWILFSCVALSLVAFAERAEWFTQAVARESQRATRAYLTPLFAILGVELVGGALSEDAQLVYGLALLVGLGVLWRYRDEVTSLVERVTWRGVGAGALVYALWIWLEPAASPLGAELAAGDALDLRTPVRILGTVLVVPVAEELAFRGYLTRRLIARRFNELPLGTATVHACVVSSVLFGLAHERWVAGMLAGFVYALVLYRTKRLSEAVVAHAVTNGLLVIRAFAAGG